MQSHALKARMPSECIAQPVAEGTVCVQRRPPFLFSDRVEEFEDIRNGRGLASDEVDLWEVTGCPSISSARRKSDKLMGALWPLC
jgi:hypothetical protein